MNEAKPFGGPPKAAARGDEVHESKPPGNETRLEFVSFITSRVSVLRTLTAERLFVCFVSFVAIKLCESLCSVISV